jgi:hypothetical protein
VAATASIPAPSVGQGININATAIAAQASIPAPTIHTGATATSNAVPATSSIPQPVIHWGVTIAPSVISASVSFTPPLVSIKGQYGTADMFGGPLPGEAVSADLEMAVMAEQEMQHSETEDGQAAYSRSEGHSL